MTKIEPGHYLGLLRGDYLYHIGKMRDKKSINECLDAALRYFLSFDENKIRHEASVQRIRTPYNLPIGGFEFHMYMIHYEIKGELAFVVNNFPRVKDDKIVNVALRVWLRDKTGLVSLKP